MNFKTLASKAMACFYFSIAFLHASFSIIFHSDDTLRCEAMESIISSVDSMVWLIYLFIHFNVDMYFAHWRSSSHLFSRANCLFVQRSFQQDLRIFWLFSGEWCWGKAMVAYKNPKQRKREKSERLRGEREIRSRLLILDLKDGKL